MTLLKVTVSQQPYYVCIISVTRFVTVDPVQCIERLRGKYTVIGEDVQ